MIQFHQTFRLKCPVPTDIVPLLSAGKKPTSPVADEKSSPTDKQDSTTQEEKKAEQHQTASSSKQDTASEKTTDKSTTTKSEKPSGEANKPAKSTFKFNVKATEFKPNPTAPAFVPVSFISG